MKNFLSFLGAFCIILLISFVFSPSYAGDVGKKNDFAIEKSFSASKSDIFIAELVALKFYSADLAKRISLPEPAVKTIYSNVENDKSMDNENRILKEKVRQEKEPRSNI